MAILALALGCAGTQGPSSGRPAALVVHSAPPPQRPDTPVNLPGQVWVRGHWLMVDGAWRWQKGRLLPARPGHTWQQGYWQHQRGSYRWRAGRWRSDESGTDHEDPRPAAAQRVSGELTPPPAMDSATEALPMSPPPPPRPELLRDQEGSVWIAGHYRWTDGHYQWVAGRRETAREGMVWRSGYWQHLGEGYRWIPGRWVAVPARSGP